MAKKTHRHLSVLLVLWVCILATVLTVYAQTAWNGNGTIVENTLTYTWTSALTKVSEDDSLSEKSAGATGTHSDVTTNATGGSFKIKLSATTSEYYSESSNGCTTHYRPGTHTTSATITNISNKPIKITKIDTKVTGGSGNIDKKTDDILLASTGTIKLSVTATPDDNVDETPNTAEYEVTITFEYLDNLELRADPSANTDYSFSVAGTTYDVGDTAVVKEFAAGTQVTPTITVPDGYTFHGWRLSTGELLAAGESFALNTDTAIYPILVSPDQQKVFQVGSTVSDDKQFWFWEDAVAAAKANSETIVLLADYTLPDNMHDAGVTSKGGAYVTGTDGNMSYIIPAGVNLLIPYGFDDTGSFGATPENYITHSAGVALFDKNQKITERNFAYRTLTVPSGTKIDCYGGLNPNGQRQPDGQPYSGAALGGYGKIHLSGSGTQLTVHNGGALYCYGYITGSGMVEILAGGKVHEFLQLCDWTGGSNASNWNGAAKENQSLFFLSQYYVQSIEAPMTIKYGAQAFCEAVLTGKGLSGSVTQPVSVPYITASSGLFILENSNSYIVRQYNTAEDRMTYNLYGNIKVGSISVSVTYGVPITLSSDKYVLPLPSNMTLTVQSGTTTMDKNIAILPGAEGIVGENGTLNLSGELYIVDVNDWTNSYFFNRAGLTVNTGYSISNTAPNTAPLPYVATLNSISPRTRALVRGKSGSDTYYMDAINATESGKLEVNGVLNITGSGSICTTNQTASIDQDALTSVDVNKVVTGSGFINYESTPADGTLSAGYSSTITTIATANGYGNLAGVGTLQPFAAGDYYGTGDYWYQHVINTEGGTVTVTSTNGAEGSTLSPLDTRKDGISDVVARVANGGSITYTIPAGYGVSINGTFQTPDDKGVYTLSNITADTTLVLHKHTSGTAVRENETRATCTTAGSYDSVVYCTGCGEELSRTQETEPAAGHSGEYALVDGMYTRNCEVCGETETEYPVQLMGMSLWTDGEVGLWLKVEISDILLEQNDAYIVVTEEANAIEDEQVTRFTMAQLKEEGMDSKGRYILKQSIASGEMTGDVTITAYDASEEQLCIGDYKEGADFLDDTNPKAVTRTVLDYVRLVLAADPETYADLRAMVTAMVTYGGYAQKYFGVDTENLAYDVLDEFDVDMPDLSLVSIDQELTITPSGAAAAVLSELGDTAETEPSVSETEAEETVESSTEPTVTETTPEETVESETVPEETAAADETVPADTASGETQAETVVTESTESTEADTSAYTADVSISVMSVASTASTESTAETSGFGLEYASQTVTLDSKISLKTYFTLAEGTSIEDYTFTYTRQGSETTEVLTAVQSGSRYYVLIENIPVAYWDSMYDLTVTDREGNTYTVSSSVLAWVQRCLTGTDQGTALNSLARAMFWYNQYANAYFGK